MKMAVGLKVEKQPKGWVIRQVEAEQREFPQAAEIKPPGLS